MIRTIVPMTMTVTPRDGAERLGDSVCSTADRLAGCERTDPILRAPHSVESGRRREHGQRTGEDICLEPSGRLRTAVDLDRLGGIGFDADRRHRAPDHAVGPLA